MNIIHCMRLGDSSVVRTCNWPMQRFNAIHTLLKITVGVFLIRVFNISFGIQKKLVVRPTRVSWNAFSVCSSWPIICVASFRSFLVRHDKSRSEMKMSHWNLEVHRRSAVKLMWFIWLDKIQAHSLCSHYFIVMDIFIRLNITVFYPR